MTQEISFLLSKEATNGVADPVIRTLKVAKQSNIRSEIEQILVDYEAEYVKLAALFESGELSKEEIAQEYTDLDSRTGLNAKLAELTCISERRS